MRGASMGCMRYWGSGPAKRRAMAPCTSQLWDLPTYASLYHFFPASQWNSISSTAVGKECLCQFPRAQSCARRLHSFLDYQRPIDYALRP